MCKYYVLVVYNSLKIKINTNYHEYKKTKKN